ncbi:MAG: hypothetical protein AAFV95_18930 [Bacteroidota bacterium]
MNPMSEKNMEDLFKKSSETDRGFAFSEDAWADMENRLDDKPRRRGLPIWLLGGGLLLLGLASALYFAMQTPPESTTQPLSIQQNNPVSAPASDTPVPPSRQVDDGQVQQMAKLSIQPAKPQPKNQTVEKTERIEPTFSKPAKAVKPSEEQAVGPQSPPRVSTTLLRQSDGTKPFRPTLEQPQVNATTLAQSSAEAPALAPAQPVEVTSKQASETAAMPLATTPGSTVSAPADASSPTAGARDANAKPPSLREIMDPNSQQVSPNASSQNAKTSASSGPSNWAAKRGGTLVQNGIAHGVSQVQAVPPTETPLSLKGWEVNLYLYAGRKSGPTGRFYYSLDPPDTVGSFFTRDLTLSDDSIVTFFGRGGEILPLNGGIRLQQVAVSVGRQLGRSWYLEAGLRFEGRTQRFPGASAISVDPSFFEYDWESRRHQLILDARIRKLFLVERRLSPYVGFRLAHSILNRVKLTQRLRNDAISFLDMRTTVENDNQYGRLNFGPEAGFRFHLTEKINIGLNASYLVDEIIFGGSPGISFNGSMDLGLQLGYRF